MASSRLVLIRYARALYQLADEAGEVERVTGDLDDLAAVIAENSELADQLANPRVPVEAKKRLLKELLGVVCADLVRRTVLLLADKGRADSVAGLASAFDEVAMQAQGRLVAEVESATALDEATRAGLLEQLTALTGKTITLKESVDTDLLGGVRIRLGSRMIDGSLRRRLEVLGERLFRVPLGNA